MLQRRKAFGEMAGYHREKGGHTPPRNKEIIMHTITYRRKHDGEEVMWQSNDINEVFVKIADLAKEGYKFEHIYEEL